MSNDELIPLSIVDDFLHTTTGHDILRYISLPDIFGAEADSLLYFTGRKLARKLDIKKTDDIFYMFKKLGWGNLELIKEKKNSMRFFLMSDEIIKRIQAPIPVDFQLECGFLAEAIEKAINRPCECTNDVNERLYRVQFNVMFTDY